MRELIDLVSSKAHLESGAAETAVQTVLNYLKEKLPAPIASQIDSLVGGSRMPAQGDMGQGLGEGNILGSPNVH